MIHSHILLISIPLALSTFIHLWNPAGFPSVNVDEDNYMKRYTFIAEYPKSPKLNHYYDHPYFGFIFLGILLKIIGYPNMLSPFANGITDPHLIEMLYFFPRLLVGILGVVDTFLIYKIAECHYNRNIAFIASILFAVMPSTELLRHMWLDDIQLPFLLTSILFAMYAASTNTNDDRSDKRRMTTIIILLSGVFLGTAIFTKIPAFTMIPFVGFLAYKNSKSLKILGYWFIPVILIPLIWPAYAMHIGEFKQWYAVFYYQLHRPHAEGFTFFDSIKNAFFQNDPVIFVLGIIGLSFAAIKKDIFILLWVIPFGIFLSSLTFVQYFYWIPVLPAFCIAAARVISVLSCKVSKYKIRNRRIHSQILTIALVSAIGLFELPNVIVSITSNVNSSLFEALAFVYQHLPPYNISDNSDTIYLTHYYHISSYAILDNRLPLKTAIPTTLLAGNETSWSAPLKEKNVNYIENTFSVISTNKLDSHAGIVWIDSNNKEYYVFLRPGGLSIASPGQKEIFSALGGEITHENSKEFTLKIAYMNNNTAIKIFVNDIPTIQLPNTSAGASNDHISKVGIRSFNSIARFELIKIGTVSNHQFQTSNTIQLVSNKILNYRYNLTMISDPRYEWIPHYIFHREYGYSILLSHAKGNFTFVLDDGDLMSFYKHACDESCPGIQWRDGLPIPFKNATEQIRLYHNSTHIIAVDTWGLFTIRTS